MYVAIYMIAIIAVCLVIYFTLPETGSRTVRATVALADPEVLEGEQLEVSRTVSAGSQPNTSPS